jgi:cytochrome c-type biogenesis protein CcmE
MRYISKLILPLISISVLAVIYIIYFAPTSELGSFTKFEGGSEINQQINVRVVKENGLERDSNGRIISFYAKDKNNLTIKIALHNPVSDDIVNAEVVELMGHMHGGNFTAASVNLIK